MGALTAAVSTSRLLWEERPEKVLFVGTCGGYDDRLKVGDLLAAKEAIATSVEELEGRAYRPEVERYRWSATWSLPFAAHSVAVPPAITRTALGARVLSSIAAAEHLEITGVFAACHAAGTPVAALLGVSNLVGPDAHAEWLTNHARVSRALIESALSAGVFRG